MILNMVGGGGAGLNFSVSAFASKDALPASASPNSVAVITETPITSWILSATEPENASAGMVWIMFSMSGKVSFNALAKNAIMICPVSVYQYDSNAWMEKDSVIYQGGWVEFGSLYLYNKGGNTGYSFACDTTMKQTSSGHPAESARVIIGDTTVTVKCTTRGYDFTNIFTTDSSGSFVAVDLSEYTKVRIKGAVSGASTDTACVFRVLSEMGDLCTKNNVLSQSLYTGTIDATIDISSVNASVYLGFTFYNSNQGVPELVLSELWLE